MSEADYDIEGLAAYLHLSPQQVAKLADRRKLPGRKVGGQWRFARGEIHHWFERRIGISDDGQLAEVEGVLRHCRRTGDAGEISIADMLPPEAIAVPLLAKTRNSVISAMVHLAAQTCWLWDPPKMLEAVLSREDLYPTALDNGVALMHPRRPMPKILDQPFLALGCTSQGIPFGGGGSGLTDVFFLVCSTEDRGHLRVLARLSRLIGMPTFLSDLRAAPDSAAAGQLIVDYEQKLVG
ncbi:MAG: PTS sugar transporter subunit IIA [Pirellulales bacterium]|jgi:nitrogen PTS system EIIA component